MTTEGGSPSRNAYIPAPPPPGSAWGEQEFHYRNLGLNFWTMPCNGTYLGHDEQQNLPIVVHVQQPRYSDLIWATVAIKTLIENRDGPGENRGSAHLYELTGSDIQLDLDLDWEHDTSQMVIFSWQTPAQPFDGPEMRPGRYLDGDDDCIEQGNVMTERKKSV